MGTYHVEVKWRGEFNFSRREPHVTLGSAVNHASALANLESVKGTRVVDSEGKVFWSHGRYVEQGEK